MIRWAIILGLSVSLAYVIVRSASDIQELSEIAREYKSLAHAHEQLKFEHSLMIRDYEKEIQTLRQSKKCLVPPIEWDFFKGE